MNLKDIRQGDVFSESSVYIFENTMSNGNLQFTHTSSKQKVELTPKYVEDLLVTADQYSKEVVVGKEDKLWTQAQIDKESKTDVKVGDVRQEGIRTIFENIGKDVFTCCFQKQPVVLSKKTYNEQVNEAVSKAIEQIEVARKQKKSMFDAAQDVIKELVENPIVKEQPGEERILRGYKMQFSSRDGKYQCFDCDINQPRPVNINTLLWIVVGDVKYILE